MTMNATHSPRDVAEQRDGSYTCGICGAPVVRYAVGRAGWQHTPARTHAEWDADADRAERTAARTGDPDACTPTDCPNCKTDSNARAQCALCEVFGPHELPCYHDGRPISAVMACTHPIGCEHYS